MLPSDSYALPHLSCASRSVFVSDPRGFAKAKSNIHPYSSSSIFQGDDRLANRSIVNVSSVAGLHGNVGQANYAAAKAAVTGFTKTIAKEWGAFNVRANTVAYGHVLTRYVSS